MPTGPVFGLRFGRPPDANEGTGRSRTHRSASQELRGEGGILDSALARSYGVTTFRSNEAVKRNLGRFPAVFRLQFSTEEMAGQRDSDKHLAEIERTLLSHDTAPRDLDGKPRPLTLPPPQPKRREMGFHAKISQGE